MFAVSGLHGFAAGFQTHYVGTERPFERLPGAGKQAAAGQPAAGGSDSRLVRKEHITVPGLVPAGKHCPGAPRPGKTLFVCC